MPGRRADGEDERASADQLIGTCCGTPTLCTRGTKHNRPTIQKAIDPHEPRNSSVWVLIVPPGLDTTWTSGPLRLRPAPVGWLWAAASAAFPAAWVQARLSRRPQTMIALATPARTPPRSCLARCTSAACRPGSLRHGCARSPHRRPAETAAGAPGWRSGRPSRGHPRPADTADRRSRRPDAQPAGPNCVSTGCRIRFGTPRTPPIAAGAASYAWPGSRPPPAAGIGVPAAVQGGSRLAQRSTASPTPTAGFPDQHRARCRLDAGRVDVANGCWPGCGHPVERQRPATAARRP
jgi:hypothetical protein